MTDFGVCLLVTLLSAASAPVVSLLYIVFSLSSSLSYGIEEIFCCWIGSRIQKREARILGRRIQKVQIIILVFSHDFQSFTGDQRSFVRA